MKILKSTAFREALTAAHAATGKKGGLIGAFTGHRIDDLPRIPTADTTVFAADFIARRVLPGNGQDIPPLAFAHVGMADGIDTAAGLALARLKREGGVPVTVNGQTTRLPVQYAAFIPMHGHQDWFRDQQRDWYEEILEGADLVGYCLDARTARGYETANALTARNGWMLDGLTPTVGGPLLAPIQPTRRPGMLHAFQKGKPGGTANCMTQAEKRGIRIKNHWGDFFAEATAALT